MSLMQLIEDYDYGLRLQIAELKAENRRLREENDRLLQASLEDARMRAGLLLKSALAGVFTSPQETK